MGVIRLSQAGIRTLGKRSNFLAGNPPFLYGVAGYFGGGADQSTVDKYAFPSNSRSTLSPGMNSQRTGVAAMANSGVAGYIQGGQFATVTNESSKFAFPTDTLSVLTDGLFRRNHAGMANSGVAGYLGGGGNPFGESTVRKMAFSTDTGSDLTTGLSVARVELAAHSNSGVAGYFLGGGTSSQRFATVDKYLFSNDTRSINASISNGRGALAGMSRYGVAGYVGGGTEGTATDVATVDKHSFPTDTLSILSSNLGTPVRLLAAMADTFRAGYFSGGVVNGTIVSTTTTMPFSSETFSVITGLSSPRHQLAGMADSGAL